MTIPTPFKVFTIETAKVKDQAELFRNIRGSGGLPVWCVTHLNVDQTRHLVYAYKTFEEAKDAMYEHEKKGATVEVISPKGVVMSLPISKYPSPAQRST